MNIKIKNEIISYDFFYILLMFIGILILAWCDTFMLKVIHFKLYDLNISVAFSGLLFPLGLIVSNVIIEKYSPTHSYFFIILLASFQFIYSIGCVFISFIPSEHYAAYAEVYQRNALICIGGTLGIFLGYLCNHQSIKFISDTFEKIPLLIRDLTSNIISKFFICFFSYSFIFWFQKPYKQILAIIFWTWLYKVIIGTILIPLMIPLIKYVTFLTKVNKIKQVVYR